MSFELEENKRRIRAILGDVTRHAAKGMTKDDIMVLIRAMGYSLRGANDKWRELTFWLIPHKRYPSRYLVDPAKLQFLEK